MLAESLVAICPTSTVQAYLSEIQNIESSMFISSIQFQQQFPTYTAATQDELIAYMCTNNRIQLVHIFSNTTRMITTVKRSVNRSTQQQL